MAHRRRQVGRPARGLRAGLQPRQREQLVHQPRRAVAAGQRLGQRLAALDLLGADAKHIAVYSRLTQRAARAVVQRRWPNRLAVRLEEHQPAALWTSTDGSDKLVNTFGEVFDAHAKVMDDRGLTRHRFNACGYSVGARFAPSWMEHQMFHAGNPQEISADMSLFVHMIIMDSDRETAMTLGHTYLTTETAPRAHSRHSLELINV